MSLSVRLSQIKQTNERRDVLKTRVASMPNLMVEGEDADNVIVYILSRKRRMRRACDRGSCHQQIGG
jgi:hypothetical protein